MLDINIGDCLVSSHLESSQAVYCTGIVRRVACTATRAHRYQLPLQVLDHNQHRGLLPGRFDSTKILTIYIKWSPSLDKAGSAKAIRADVKTGIVSRLKTGGTTGDFLALWARNGGFGEGSQGAIAAVLLNRLFGV